MESYATGRSRWSRMLDTIAMVAADSSFGERSSVNRALYAVLLADALNLTPAEAAERACEAAWISPQRELSDKARALVEEADKAQMAVIESYGDGGRFYINAHLPESVREDVYRLVNAGQLINAIRLVREVTSLGIKEAKDIVDEMRNSLSDTFNGPTQTPFSDEHNVDPF